MPSNETALLHNIKAARNRFWRIQNWSNHPVAAQRQVLQDLVTAGQYTEFGKKYHFAKLFTLKEFKKNIPIQEYDDVKPYINRMMQAKTIFYGTRL
ncbi:MAG: GH3 auxin-responsive promoter family protein [Ferruginibacter sp.]